MWHNRPMLCAHPTALNLAGCLITTLVIAVLSAGNAAAVSLKLHSQKKPKSGVVIKHYRSTSPTARLWVADIDLCAAQIHIDATRPPSGLQTAGAWGSKVGALLATNGDFYKTGPVRVYGQAVGRGVAWPAKQTGSWSGYSGQWYYKDYGWIALLHDNVLWSHSGYSKKNAAKLKLKTGWSPTAFTHGVPTGAIGLVSGFPQLVVEGKQVTCSSPTAKSCFPDRSDMRARHPRTAMGITADRKHLLLLVVDGRTSKSKGMYGAELAEVMKKLGAWQAFNLDGGGSSEMWLAGTGYLNDVKGNNGGGSARAVANHWGILVKDRPKRPGHCVASKPCGTIGAAGGIVDDASPCFVPHGPMKYWRSEKKGYGGGLRWTNATSGAVPGNWAWWRLHFAEAGKYKLEYRAEKAWAVHKKVRYVVRANNKSTTLFVDQSKGGTWRALGTFDFKKGGLQWLAVYDANGNKVASNQHIVADAVRLTRVGAWCGNKKCDGGETCGSCAKDCGPCAKCGDGKCNGSETCGTCAKDCGPCIKCGDGKCNGGETCSSCAKDCGACPTVDAGNTDSGADTGPGAGGISDAGAADTATGGSGGPIDAFSWPEVGAMPDDDAQDDDAQDDDGADDDGRSETTSSDTTSDSDRASGGGSDIHDGLVNHDADAAATSGGPVQGGAASSGCQARRTAGGLPRMFLVLLLAAFVLIARRPSTTRRASTRKGVLGD